MMKNYKLLFIVLFSFSLAACNSEAKKEVTSDEQTEKNVDLSANEQLAQNYGIDNFSTIDTINFTFNVRPAAEADTISRSWMWLPKKNHIALMKDGQWVHYLQDTIKSKKFLGMDAAFINDQYWLIYPFRTLWDEGTNISSDKGVRPFSSDTVNTMTIAYTDSTGYTPKDTYKLYMNENDMVAAWEYYPGSGDKAAVVTSWEEIKTFKGIKVPTKFINSENGFAVFLSGITMK